MRTATALFASVLCAAVCAAVQKESAPIFACNLKANQRRRSAPLSRTAKRIRRAIRDRSEIPNGYALKLDSKVVTLPEAAEWISMERLCCPFLTLQISASGNQPHWVLTLTGPEGVKAILDAEFPAP
jgi:hypothetical protein